MAYAETTADRLRECLSDTRGITQKKMFGGLCFLHRGNMLCGIDNKSRLMLRVGPDNYDKILKLKHASEMDFTGKPLKGMVYVSAEGYKTKAALSKWVERALEFTRTLPKK